MLLMMMLMMLQLLQLLQLSSSNRPPRRLWSCNNDSGGGDALLGEHGKSRTHTHTIEYGTMHSREECIMHAECANVRSVLLLVVVDVVVLFYVCNASEALI